MEKLFISTRSSFDIHGSLTIHNCTIEIDSMVLNLEGGTYLSSADQGNGTHLQTYFEKHAIKVIQTHILGSNLSAYHFHGKIHFHTLFAY